MNKIIDIHKQCVFVCLFNFLFQLSVYYSTLINYITIQTTYTLHYNNSIKHNHTYSWLYISYHGGIYLVLGFLTHTESRQHSGITFKTHPYDIVVLRDRNWQVNRLSLLLFILYTILVALLVYYYQQNITLGCWSLKRNNLLPIYSCNLFSTSRCIHNLVFINIAVEKLYIMHCPLPSQKDMVKHISVKIYLCD